MPRVNVEKQNRLSFERASQLFEYDPSVASGLRWKERKRGRQRNMAGSASRNASGHVHYQVTVDNILYLTYRIIWLLHHGVWPANGMVVDHIIGLDAGGSNAIENLRVVSQQANLRGYRSKPTKGYHPNGKGWQVQLQHPITLKFTNFGTYPTESDAIEVVEAVQWAFRYLWPECY